MKILVCKFNIDTACVEVWGNDGRVISIYTPAIEVCIRGQNWIG